MSYFQLVQKDKMFDEGEDLDLANFDLEKTFDFPSTETRKLDQYALFLFVKVYI